MENNKPDYYINKKRKVVDFLIGFIGFPALYWICFVLVPELKFLGSATVLAAIGLFAAPLILLGVFAGSRRFVAIGAAGFVATIVALMFGTCLIVPFIH